MKLGIRVLLDNKKLRDPLKNRRLALLAHPASQSISPQGKLIHTIDALAQCSDLRLCSAFGPQHGMRGEKQDNMEESNDYIDPIHQIPVFSLYGNVRKPTEAMLDTFDILLIDIQDVGTRVYTFLTTLLYLLEAGAKAQKSIWILDRPNPAGRPVEGTLLEPKGWTSFVGAAEFPMRHGLTLGEAAKWFVKNKRIAVDLQVVPMQDYSIEADPGFGWPSGELPWINPSPNASTLSMARCYPGTVLLEGTQLSEGRGTTHPLEMLGAPDIDAEALLKTMETLAPQWMLGCLLRPCYFQPTFQKHTGKMCSGFQIHVDDFNYKHNLLKPYRLIALALKALRLMTPDYPIWRDFHYEYEKDRLAIDLINGGPSLRQWVDSPKLNVADFEKTLVRDEAHWIESRKDCLIYG